MHALTQLNNFYKDVIKLLNVDIIIPQLANSLKQ